MTISEAFFSSAACAANRAFARDSRVIAVTLLPAYSCTTRPISVFWTISYWVTAFKDTISRPAVDLCSISKQRKMSTKVHASNIEFDYK